MDRFAQFWAVSAVAMGIAHTITRERLFAPLRDRLGGNETWWGYLVSCPYCVSHWVAAALVPLTGMYVVPIAPDWGVASWILGWILSAILVAVAAAFLRVIFYFVDEGQGLVRRQKETEQLKVASSIGRLAPHVDRQSR